MAFDQTGEMIDLLRLARPTMGLKCCHWDWCIERRGVVSNDETEGFPEIRDGMHPGCAPSRDWLRRVDDLLRQIGRSDSE